MVASLRKSKIDIGTNYPPVDIFFPSYIPTKRSTSGNNWGNQVANLWLTQNYNDERKRAVVKLMETAFNQKNLND